MQLRIELLKSTYAISRLDPDTQVPDWALKGEFQAAVRTRDELSIVCEAVLVPQPVKVDPGWRILMVQGPLDFSLVGILANLANILANAGVSIFSISTFDTDYILVKQNQLESALASLKQAGHRIC